MEYSNEIIIAYIKNNYRKEYTDKIHGISTVMYHNAHCEVIACDEYGNDVDPLSHRINYSNSIAVRYVSINEYIRLERNIKIFKII